ncbi:glycosyl hydrolase [Arthrobacter sp. Hiyo1]|nr:glycosyl hydrolase [Arthrobacter sp. Hiyo1]
MTARTTVRPYDRRTTRSWDKTRGNATPSCAATTGVSSFPDIREVLFQCSGGISVSKRFPGRRLSVLRLGILCVIVVAAVTAGYLGLRNVQDVSAAASMPSVFSGYVDVTATPRFAFEDPAVPSAKAVVLSFVVADPKQGCAPSWGAAYSPDQAASDLDLDRRIARLRQLGGPGGFLRRDEQQ